MRKSNGAALAALMVLAGCASSEGPAFRPEVFKIERWAIINFEATCSVDLTEMLPDAPGKQMLQFVRDEGVLANALKLPANVADKAYREVLVNRLGERALTERFPEHLRMLSEGMGVTVSKPEDLTRSVTYRFLRSAGRRACAPAGMRPVLVAQDDGPALKLVARELAVDGLVSVQFGGLGVVPNGRTVNLHPDSSATATMDIALFGSSGAMVAHRSYGPVSVARAANGTQEANEWMADFIGVPNVEPTLRMVGGAMDAMLKNFVADWQKARR